MTDQTLLPVQWVGRQAVATLPEHIDASNSGEIREELLRLINRGAAILVVDMSATISCDHGGADALLRAYHRAAGNGAQLRLVVNAAIVRRVLDANGLDRVVSIYPSVEAALAAGTPSRVIPLVPRPASGRGDRPGSPRPVARAGGPEPGERASPSGATVTPAVLWRVVDALDDGVLLVGDDGVVALVNRRLEEMFGYRHGELTGRPIESLVPARLRVAHAAHRADYARAPVARLMATRGRLVGLRKDGSTFPVQVSLTPVPTATGRFTLAVVRDAARPHVVADLAEYAQHAVAARRADRAAELFQRIVSDLHKVGMSLEGAVELPHDHARHRIEEAVRHLDETIREIRDHVFGGHRPADDPGGPPPG